MNVTITYIPVDATHRIEAVMPSRNHYPQHLMYVKDAQGVSRESWGYYRRNNNKHVTYKSERGARKYLAQASQ